MKIRLLLIALLLWSAEPLNHSTQAKDGPLSVGQRIPDFSMKTLQGKTIKLSQLAADKKQNSSGITVLTFWCSFCGSCRRVERPLSELAQKYRGKVAIMAIDSSVGENGKEVAAFLKEHRLTMPVMMDPRGHVADLFGAKMTTTTVVIDAQGTLQYFGQFKQGDMKLAEEAVQSVLTGQKPRHSKTTERG